MESPKIVYKYYSNPAFCAQSEVVFSSKSPCVTSKIQSDRRMPPLGRASPRKVIDSNRITRTDISDNPLRNRRDVPPELPPKPAKFNRSFHRQSSLIVKPNRASVRCRTRSEDLEMAQFKQSREQADCEEKKLRYEIIDFDDTIDFSPTKKRIVENEDLDEYNVDGPDENELKEIPTEIVKTVNGKALRYAIVPTDDDYVPTVTFSPMMSQRNLIATQKLHELLSTPRKLKSYASQPSVRMTPKNSPHGPTPRKVVASTPTGITPSKSCANLSRSIGSPISPKAQQKLNYGLEDRDVFVTSFRDKSRDRSLEDRVTEKDKRRDKSTAVIMPRVAVSPPSVYSEDTYKSWGSLKAARAAAPLAVAALMMTLSGALAAGLGFYMMYSVARRYYLDFAVLSGFTCLLLGLLGFQSRRHHLLPNRNYVSGYILLSTFSIFSAAGLLVLLIMEPKPGTPLNDITSGAVCALSALSLAVASVGAVSSLCCQRPPRDNRVDAG